MAMIDPFSPSAFTLTALTAAINNLKFRPQRLTSLFEEQGVSATTVSIEERDGVLSLLEPRPRGAPAQTIGVSERRLIPFLIPHIPVMGSLHADEVQGIRAFGTESIAETVQTRLNEKLQIMRDNIDYTIESHRAAAIKGNYIDANGDEVSLFTTFNVSQNTKALGLHATNSSGVRGKMFESHKLVATALGGTPYSRPVALCGDNFWAALIEDKDTKATYLNQQQASDLRGDPAGRFNAYGVDWEWYRGTSDVNFGSDAYLIPTGVPGLCITRYAPANYNETVNTNGLPYYVKSERIRFDKGYEFEAQSNPLNLVTRPAAIVKLTIS